MKKNSLKAIVALVAKMNRQKQSMLPRLLRTMTPEQRALYLYRVAKDRDGTRI